MPNRLSPRRHARIGLTLLLSLALGAALTTHARGKLPEGLSSATFASGCFWCVEAIFESVDGVHEAISGYAGGPELKPKYEQVARGKTGHAEAVEVHYDPNVVSYAQLVDVFFGSQDPTQVDGQGPDHGRQYRSAIFYATAQEKAIAEAAKKKLASSYSQPIAAEIVPLERFWKAEAYHQDYERRNPNNPYIRGVSIPRLQRFQAKFPELLKENGGHE